MNDIAKLNRLRVNAGKNELKSWKASQAQLVAQIERLEADGYTDALPGAKVDAKPTIEDPEIAAARPEVEEKPSLKDSAMAKNIAAPTDTTGKPVTKVKAHLARGLETDTMARGCREKVRDQRRDEKKAKLKDKVKLTPADKKQIKDEAKSNIAGRVDPKRDPEKAARQEKHVKDKQAARAGKPKKETNANEVTVAEIARELGIDPKVARAKLRRHEDKLSKLHTKGQDRWTFPKSAKAEISKILK